MTRGWADYNLFCAETRIPRSTVSTWAKRYRWQTVALNGRVYYPKAELVEQMKLWDRRRANRKAA